MTAIRQEILDYISDIPDSKLDALKPLLALLLDDMLIIETGLTDKEKDIIKAGRKEYKQGTFIPLDSIQR